MNKMEYKEPEFTVVNTSAEDVLTASYQTGQFETGPESIIGF